jgi:hypothetical protein
MSLFVRTDHLRIDSSSPPTIDNSQLAWNGNGGIPGGVTASFTDLDAEAEESNRGVIGSVVLGLAGTIALASLPFFVRFGLSLWRFTA